MRFSLRRFQRQLSTLSHMLTKACCEALERRCLLSGEPLVTASEFAFVTAPQELRFGFDQDVSASLGTADMILKNVTSGQTISTGDMSLIWDGAVMVAKFRFPGLPNGALPDGNYLATLSASGITNGSGQALLGDHDFDFFVFTGDVAGNPEPSDPDRRDRGINLTDFNVVAANFGQSNASYWQGDLNYDGNVNLVDFDILASKFGATLDEVAGPGEISVTATSSSTIALQWSGKDVEGEDGWRLQISTNGQQFFFLTNLPEDTETFEVINLQDGTRYWFRVRAFGNGQDTPYTPKQAATTSLPPPQVTSISPISASQLKIIFADNSQNELWFQVYRSLDPVTGFAPVGDPILTGEPTEFTDNVTPGTTYHYQVKAHNNAIESAPSNPTSAGAGPMSFSLVGESLSTWAASGVLFYLRHSASGMDIYDNPFGAGAPLYNIDDPFSSLSVNSAAADSGTLEWTSAAAALSMLTINGGTLTTISGGTTQIVSLTGTGSLYNDGITEINGDVNLATDFRNTGIVMVGGNMNVGRFFNNFNTLAVEGDVIGGASVNNNSSMEVGGNVTIPDNLNNSAGSTITIGGDVSAGSALSNGAGATMTIQGDIVGNGTPEGGNTVINNSGTMIIDGDASPGATINNGAPGISASMRIGGNATPGSNINNGSTNASSTLWIGGNAAPGDNINNGGTNAASTLLIEGDASPGVNFNNSYGSSAIILGDVTPGYYINNGSLSTVGTITIFGDALPELDLNNSAGSTLYHGGLLEPGGEIFNDGTVIFFSRLSLDSNNDGVIDASDDLIEDDPDLPGVIIAVNDDDDNDNDTPDHMDAGFAEEDDLVRMEVDLPDWWSSADTVKLRLESGADKVKVWTTEQKSNLVALDQPLNLSGDATFWVEGIAASNSLADIRFALLCTPVGATRPATNPARANGVNVDIDPLARFFDTETGQYTNGTLSDITGTNINEVVNPAAFVRMAAGDATLATAAIVRLTRFDGFDPPLQDDDARITWEIDQSAGGNAAFLNPTDNGRTVHVHGTNVGRVLLKVKYNNKVLETYEALVVEERTLPFRVQLLTGAPGEGTAASPQQAERQVRIANSYLRQIGVKLVPDTNNDVEDGAQLVPGMPGFFRTTVPPALFRDLVNSPNAQNTNLAIGTNQRPKVLQIVYVENLIYPETPPGQGIHALAGHTRNAPGSTVDDVSLEYRIVVEEKARSHTMQINWSFVGGVGPDNWGLLIGNAFGTHDAASHDTHKVHYGLTLAHEVGHVLSFRHRDAPSVSDGLNKPQDKNLMDVFVTGTQREDLDLIQAHAVQYAKVFAGP